jgi:hypothetical protein
MGYWRDYPPTHLLARAYMGAGEKEMAKRTNQCTDGDLDDFLMALDGAGATVDACSKTRAMEATCR